MKTKIKTLLLSVILFLTLSLGMNAQAPSALSVQGGYSWINGVIGANYQYGHLGISSGWMPTTMPLSGEKINSFGAAITAYTGNYDESSYYLSLGYASNGYRYQYTSTYYGSTEMTSPMTILMVGYKLALGDLNIKVGGGYGWCEYSNAGTWELTLGYTLFNNY